MGRRILETAVGFLLVCCGAYVGVIGGSVWVALGFVGTGSFFISKSLMVEVMGWVLEVIRAKKG